MNHKRAAQAVHNNAVWCDTVCRAHGRPGEFLDGIWVNRRETPRFYPNAVTLSKTGESAAQVACIHDLIEAGIPGEWGVKDSFCTLDLAPVGFRILFEAAWIWRPVSLPRPNGDITDVRWVKVNGSSELGDWETAWSSAPADEMLSTQAHIFLPSLLADENIAVIAAYQNQRIVAGAIANRTSDVVGLSNMFVPVHEAERFQAGCIAGVIAAFPGLPVVGYEAGRELAAAQSLGFEVLGPLRVWVRLERRAD